LGSCTNRGRIIPVEDLSKILKENQGIELYRSYYSFDKEILEHFQKYKSVRSFKGTTYLEKIIFDIDKDTNTDTHTLGRARAFYNRLKDDFELDGGYIRIYFSGRGYHIVIPDIFGFKPSNVLHYHVKETLEKYFPEADSIYDATRLLRVVNSKNLKTGLYKIPLTPEELFSNDAEGIKKLAEAPRTINGYYKGLELRPLPKLDHLVEYKKIALEVKEDKVAQETNYVTCVQNMITDGPTEGTRHHKLLRISDAWRKSGIPRKTAFIALKEWANNLEPEEVRHVIESVYDSTTINYGCNDKVRLKYCDPKCIFYRTRNNSVEIVSAEDAEAHYHRKMQNPNSGFSLKDIYDTDYWFNNGELTILIGDTKLGKGLRLDEDILTEKGFVKMKDLTLKDKVFDGSKFVSINWISEVWNIDNYKLTFDDNTSVICDKNHLWQVEQRDKKGNRNTRVLSAQYLNDFGLRKGQGRNERNKFRIPMIAPVDFPEKELPIEPYLLGVWLGDGTSKNANVTSADPEIMANINVLGYKTEKKKTKYSWLIKGLSEKLTSCNLKGNKHIPDVYLYGSIKQRLELVRGLMDTDGYAGNRCLEFCNTNKNLADGMIMLLRSLGIKCRIKSKQPLREGKPFGKMTYLVQFNTTMTVFRLTRKVNSQYKSMPNNRSLFRYIKSIEKVDSQPTKCISVNSLQETFVVSKDFILTHNSCIMQNIVVKIPHKKVLYFSFEMSLDLTFRRFLQIANNMTKEQVNVHYKKSKTGLAYNINHIKIIHTAPNLTDLRKIIADNSPDVVVIDTLDCLQVTNFNDTNTKTEMIANGLRMLAQSMNIGIIAIQHVSKSAAQDEKGYSKAMTVHSGKGSSSVEQKADRVLSFEGNKEMSTRVFKTLADRDQMPMKMLINFNKQTLVMERIYE
jgi:hypothetical protein